MGIYRLRDEAKYHQIVPKLGSTNIDIKQIYAQTSQFKFKLTQRACIIEKRDMSNLAKSHDRAVNALLTICTIHNMES